MMGINQIISFILSPLGLTIIGFSILTLYLFKHRQTEEPLKRKDLYKETIKDLKSYLALIDNPIGRGKILTTGLYTIGYVIKMTKLYSKPNKDKKGLNTKEMMDKDLILVKICRNNIISKFLSIMNLGVKYLIIDDEYLTQTSTEIQIIPNVQAKPYYHNVITYSKVGRAIVEDTSFRASRQAELEELINFIPKQTYLEVQQSKQMEELSMIQKIAKEKRKEQIEEIKKA